MSIYRDRVLECPHCRHAESHPVALSLDADRAANERQAIMDGSFQRFTCPACGREFRADGPLIYLDFTDKLWFGVFPRTWEQTWWQYEQEPTLAFQRNVEENSPALVRSWAPGFRIRAVFGLQGLREKLLCHSTGIDDVILEAYKLQLLRTMGPHELSARARPRLRAVDDDTLRLDVPRPEASQPSRVAQVAVARVELQRIEHEREEWTEILATLSAGPYVDLGRIFIPRPEATQP